MNLPKILIIGQSFNNDTGGGITLSNLFKGWDRDKLAVACVSHLLLDNIDTDVCNTYYQLGHKENKWSFPFNYLQRKYTSGLVQFNENRIQNLSVKKSKFRVVLIMNALYPILNFFGLIHVIHKFSLSADFCKWLDEYNPDIIYAQTTSRQGVLFCLKIESYLNKPFILHIMDDWPSTISSTGLLKKYWQKKIDAEFRILLDKSTILMSISEEMANEYKIRYNKNFITFHNTIDIDFWKKYQRKTYELSEDPTILYAGRIGIGVDTSLELIAKAIEGINKKLNMSIKLVLQTQEKPAWIKNYDHVLHKSFVPYDDLPRIFSESDMLLLPYDFSEESIKYIGFSMPTKAPEYMISGTPIIILAPEDTAIVKYARKYGWAKIVTKVNINVISEEIKQMIENKELRQQYAENAFKLAEKNHNSIEVTNRFKKVILSTMGN